MASGASRMEPGLLAEARDHDEQFFNGAHEAAMDNEESDVSEFSSKGRPALAQARNLWIFATMGLQKLLAHWMCRKCSKIWALSAQQRPSCMCLSSLHPMLCQLVMHCHQNQSQRPSPDLWPGNCPWDHSFPEINRTMTRTLQLSPQICTVHVPPVLGSA